MHNFDTTHDETALRFGRFVLYPRRRLLLDGDRPLSIGSRALDILLVLVESAGNVVSKETLIERVWPSTFVEEINLRVHISALRRALGTSTEVRSYIANVRQRGYSFVAYVEQISKVSGDLRVQAYPRQELPIRLSRIEGRDAVIDNLLRQLTSRRLISVIGPAGVGKTAVALRVAQHALGRFSDGIRFIDLAGIQRPEQLAGKLATELGLETDRENPFAYVRDFLRGRQMLLVIDNCEHLIDACAQLIDTLFATSAALHIVTTSRESLRAEGEFVQPLAGLDVPPDSPRLHLREALRYSAFRFFVRRAKARQAGFSLGGDGVAVVAAICRRLDGMPLALELAAAQIDARGLKGVLALDDHALLNAPGWRTAASRQQTLRASLDWSFALLDEPARACLMQVASFDGAFTQDDAIQVMASLGMSREVVCEALAQLVAKSLLCVALGGEAVSYRLLDITRGYGRLRAQQVAAPEPFQALSGWRMV